MTKVKVAILFSILAQKNFIRLENLQGFKNLEDFTNSLYIIYGEVPKR